MSRPLSRWQAMVLGSTVVLALGMALLGLFAVGSRGWYGSDALTVQSGFPEIRGVEVGTRVRIRGIDAGEVAAIEPPEGEGDVVLKMRIHGRYRKHVKAGSTVRIVNEGMLGGKVVEISPPKTGEGKPADFAVADEGAMLRSEPPTELTDVVGKLGKAIGDIQDGKGTLGKLAKDSSAYDALVGAARSAQGALEKSKDTLAAVQRDAEAVKRLPLIGRFVVDPQAILGRSNGEWNRKTFREKDLFEPGSARLTAPGKVELDGIAPWLHGLKHKGSEVIIVSYADPNHKDAREATALTQQQSEAVEKYLRNEHSVHSMSAISSWLASRKVIALGLGTQSPPAPHNRGTRPTPCTEVLVFVPQS